MADEMTMTVQPTEAVSEVWNRNYLWTALASKNAQALALSVHKMMDYNMACSEAAVALMMDRVGKAQEVVRACADTRDGPTLIRVAAEYQRTMLADYIGYAQNVLAMTLERAQDASTAMEERAQSALDEAKQAA